MRIFGILYLPTALLLNQTLRSWNQLPIKEGFHIIGILLPCLDQTGLNRTTGIIYIHFILCLVKDEKNCSQCLPLQSLSQFSFAAANKLIIKRVLFDSISFLPFHIGKCHNFKGLHITILKLVLLYAYFFQICYFQFSEFVFSFS